MIDCSELGLKPIYCFMILHFNYANELFVFYFGELFASKLITLLAVPEIQQESVFQSWKDSMWALKRPPIKSTAILAGTNVVEEINLRQSIVSSRDSLLAGGEAAVPVAPKQAY